MAAANSESKPKSGGLSSSSSSSCSTLPSLLSSFVDTFVDFSVSGGLFLLPPNPHTLTTTILPAPERVIAVGDLHGDLDKTKQSFRLAGLIDPETDRWTGGDTTVVQVGDVLDRGGEEIKIIYLLEKLKREAQLSGGNLITMNGNHEIMNLDADFRYVTKSGLDEFKDWAYWYCVGNVMKNLCIGLEKQKDIFANLPSNFPNMKEGTSDGIRARIAALRPGGPISVRFLSKNLTVAVVGESLFVHGGLLPKHVVYGLDRINKEVKEWISGARERVSSELVRGRNSVVWLRKFSHELGINCDCSTLEHVLATIPGAKRMIMGHTIQVNGINAVCENRAIRIDVGMSSGCGNGLPEVLEIKRNSELRILTSNPLFQKRYETSVALNQKEGVDLLNPQQPMPNQVEVKA